MPKGYRIISIEACDLYKHEQICGVEVGYKMPEYKSDAYFWLFKNILDYSLDTVELESAYTRICRKKFSFVDKHNNAYTLAVVNVKFNYTYKADDGKVVNKKALRDHFYSNGFNLDGVHYVRYKRSAGSSREGKCLFINERLYRYMTKWSECGIKPNSDLASWESYRALSLSSIKGVINIPLNGILFVPDYKSAFTDKVVSVEMQDGKLIATEKETQITNDIWDGESLLDENLFSGEYADKHFLLLRNKFFKSCAFRTKLQQWIKDKCITLEDLKERGFTLATDISQIVMVTTPNSLKYLKFVGDLNEKNIRKWADNVTSIFGVVKWDKPTHFFHGRMVQSSYQLLNTLPLTETQAEQLLQPSFEYIATVRTDIDFMRYHFTDAFAKEYEENDADDDDYEEGGLAERAEVIFKLLFTSPFFSETALYINFRDAVVSDLKKRLRRGHILFNGTNATLFGNGPELLKYIAGEEVKSVLKQGQVRSERFGNGAKLLCARSPHITMGNLYLAENNLDGDIWNYFDLGKNIVCVNAINENIQQRLNGCDYDSDAMLVTDDKLLVETAEKHKDLFKVPVCNIPSVSKENSSLALLDHDTSENKIGEIVNLSQRLNSIIWDKLNNGATEQDILPIYEDACKLAVMSGIEIDKAKRAYDNINVGKELTAIRKKYSVPNPVFFKDIDKRYKDRVKQYDFYKTSMDFIYRLVKKFHFQKGKKKTHFYEPISWVLGGRTVSDNATDYRHRDKVIALCEEYKNRIVALRRSLRNAEESEREVIYDRIAELKTERDEKISKWLTNSNVLLFVVKHYEKNAASDWRIYAPIINTKLFREYMLSVVTPEYYLEEDPNGKYSIYGMNFTKMM